MYIKIFLFLFVPIVLSCKPGQKTEAVKLDNIIFAQTDREIIDQVFTIFSGAENTPTAVLMVKVGTFFKETPYVASTLEINAGEENLVINLREMDCTTFAENCLAISRTLKKGEPGFAEFARELQNIRYRNGQNNGYTSRLHYFSDWIHDNNNKKTLENLSQEIANTPYPKRVDFMSTHPASYPQLNNDSSMIGTIAKQENEVSARKMFYIPKEKISDIESQLMDGDIVGITSAIDGLDVSHVGILIRKNGRIHLMHASSLAKKVVISNNTLEQYLLESESATGIMVARPL